MAQREPRNPCERIAAELRSAIAEGTFSPGEFLPTVAELATLHQVSTGTAHRAIALLSSENLIEVARGRRARIRPNARLAVGVDSLDSNAVEASSVASRADLTS